MMIMLFNTLCSKWYITKWILLRQMYKIQMYAITTWNFLVGIICKWNHSVVNFLRPICVSVEAITYRTQCAVFYFGIKSSTNIFIFRLFLYGYKENSDRKIKNVWCVCKGTDNTYHISIIVKARHDDIKRQQNTDAV